MREAVSRCAEMGQRHVLGLCEGLLAEAEAAAGRVEPALATVRRALAERSEPVDRPALLCLEGDLLARLANDDAASLRYRDALAAARAMHSRADELRAAVLLARGLADRGRASEARALLAPFDVSPAGGCDTPDSSEARRLLGALG